MQQNQPSEIGKEVAVGAIFVVVVMFLIWYYKHTAITSFMFTLRAWELKAISMFSADAGAAARYIAALDPSTVPYDAFRYVLFETGRMTRWIFAPILVAASVYVYLKSPADRFKKVHTTKTLLQQESELWPEIAPVVGLDLVSGDITKGPWAVNLTEWEFARKHKLVDPDGALNRERARALLKRQLGPLWRGSSQLPPYAKAIYASLIMRIAGKNKESLQRMRSLAASFAKTHSTKSMDFTWVEAAIKEHEEHPLVQKVLKRHAYVFTVFAMLLQVARADGVLAASLFVWVRPVDRRLWYTIDSVGRYAFTVEASGIMAHWLAEKELKMSLVMPCVEKAVDGLEKALKDFVEDDAMERLFH